MGSKNNPGKFDCYHNALADEPMFILLARDPSAPGLVERWARGRDKAIEMEHRPPSDCALVSEAMECAANMRRWREDNNGAWRRSGATAETAARPTSETAATSAVRDVLAERERQKSAEGFSLARDDAYSLGELAMAAICYATTASIAARFVAEGKLHSDGIDAIVKQCPPPPGWPWSRRWWKPADPRRDLVRAGALILAEIERRDRATAKSAASSAAADAAARPENIVSVGQIGGITASTVNINSGSRRG